MRLSELFAAAAAKRLSGVEADPRVSHQHELNGINRFKEMLGTERRTFRTVFLHLDDENEPVAASGCTSWYDSRENQSARPAEYRLYYPDNDVSRRLKPRDVVVIARRPDDTLLFLACAGQSTAAQQVLWLFGLNVPGDNADCASNKRFDKDVDLTAAVILESLGIEVPVSRSDAAVVVDAFGLSMPSTREFSAFARGHCDGPDPRSHPDDAVMAWLETEERLFRAIERLLLEDRLRKGFIDEHGDVDIDGFVSFSLGVQNRRKARAGHALENHLEHLFKLHGLRFARGVTTENRSKPDFLFPGQAEYTNPDFPGERLAVLGAKATCKDRWRQILGEADRIPRKHLMTLEPSITTNQTNEMQTRQVQLVVPERIHATYTAGQREWLWTVARFIEHIRGQQAA